MELVTISSGDLGTIPLAYESLAMERKGRAISMWKMSWRRSASPTVQQRLVTLSSMSRQTTILLSERSLILPLRLAALILRQLPMNTLGALVGGKATCQ